MYEVEIFAIIFLEHQKHSIYIIFQTCQHRATLYPGYHIEHQQSYCKMPIDSQRVISLFGKAVEIKTFNLHIYVQLLKCSCIKNNWSANSLKGETDKWLINPCFDDRICYILIYILAYGLYD